MSGALPFDVTYHIIEELVTPTHPLAYELEPSVHKALLSLTVLCKGIHQIAMRNLYARVSTEISDQLDLLTEVSEDRLQDLRALSIDFAKGLVPAADLDYVTERNRSSAQTAHRYITDLLSILFSSALHIATVFCLPRNWNHPCHPIHQT